MRKMKRLVSAVTTGVMTLSMAAGGMTAGLSSVNAADLSAMTAPELINEMGNGWNLGNTFDSTNTWDNPLTIEKLETAWGNPVTTQAMIDAVHTSGFDSIRIPVTWFQMTENGTIKEEYLARIKEVVDYAYKNDMFVIINMHHDGLEANWLHAGTSVKDQFTGMWTQIANYFADYDRHLVFEGWNEIGWDNATCLTMGQAFVDAVRATGGNNANRLLVVPGPNTNITATLDAGFQMPADAANMLAVDVHHYDPSTFTVCTPGEEENEWYKAVSTWGTDEEINTVKVNIANLKTKFVDNGIGVIFGEYGVENEQKEEASRLLYTKTVATLAKNMDGFAAYLWDSSNGGDMKYFDRKNLTWLNQDIGSMFSELGDGNSSSLVVDWIPTTVTQVINDKTGFPVLGSYAITVGTSKKFKLEMTSDYTSAGGTGGISYWDSNANGGEGAWIQNALNVNWSIDENGVCEVNQVTEEDENGETSVINYNFFEIPEGVSTDSVQFQIYYGGYADENGDWHSLTSDQYPVVSKAYVTGLVDQPDTSEPETSEPDTSEPETSEPDTSEPETSEPDTSEPDTSETTGGDVKYGDVNNDGEIDILDVIALNKFLLGSGTLDDNAKAAADVDVNGEIDSTDSLNILKKVVKMIETLPIS